MKITEEGLSFDDVLLVPQEGSLTKREEADISTRLVGDVPLDIPIISAPMESVTGSDMATAMLNLGAYAILHRNSSIDQQYVTFKETWNNTGISLGVNEGLDRFNALHDGGARVFCVDVAHAHHQAIGKFIEQLRNSQRECYIIAGNVATAEGACFLANLGVDGVKVGIGPGAACTTRAVTGFGVPQLTAILRVANAFEDYGEERPTLIADGGIKNSGDIVKALAAGADSVMLGRLLAGANESPLPGHYWGMASKRVNNHRAPEGVEGVVPLTGPVEDTIKELAWGIRSGISYGGGSSIQDLRDNAEFILVSQSSQAESGVRI